MTIWWEAPVTSDDVATVRDDLDNLASGLEVMQQSAGRAVQQCRDLCERMGETWGGPRPERVCGRITGYLDSIAEITNVLASASFTVTAWYNAAVWRTERLGELERRVAAAQGVVDNATAEVDDETYDELGNAISLHIESAQNWINQCKRYGDDLAPAIAALNRLGGVQAYAGGESVPPTGREFELALTDIADDLGVAAYADQPLDFEDLETVDSAGFFIAWLLDPYHDTVVAAIAAEGAASPGLGCKLDNGRLPDLCSPGSIPFRIGEVKYNSQASIFMGLAQLRNYLGTTKNGNPTQRGWYLTTDGYRTVTVGGVTVLYGPYIDPLTGSPVGGLYVYQINNWSIPELCRSRAYARAHSYVSVPEADVVPYYDLPGPAGTLTGTAAQPGSSNDGGWQPPAIPRFEMTPETAATIGVTGAIILAGVLILLA